MAGRKEFKDPNNIFVHVGSGFIGLLEYAGVVSDYPEQRTNFGFAYLDDPVFKILEIYHLEQNDRFYKSYKIGYIAYFDREGIYTLKNKSSRRFRNAMELVFRLRIK